MSSLNYVGWRNLQCAKLKQVWPRKFQKQLDAAIITAETTAAQSDGDAREKAQVMMDALLENLESATFGYSVTGQPIVGWPRWIQKKVALAGVEFEPPEPPKPNPAKETKAAARERRARVVLAALRETDDGDALRVLYALDTDQNQFWSDSIFSLL